MRRQLVPKASPPVTKDVLPRNTPGTSSGIFDLGTEAAFVITPPLRGGHEDGPEAAMPPPKPPLDLTLLDAQRFFRLMPQLLTPLTAALEAEAPEDIDAEDLACMTKEDIEMTMDAMTVDTRQLNALQKGSVRKFFWKLRGHYRNEQPVPTEAASSQAAIVLPTATDDDKEQFTMHLAQGTKGSFKELPPVEVSKLQQRYVDITGSDPLEAERPSKTQLAALCAWTAVSMSNLLGKHPIRISLFGAPSRLSSTKKDSSRQKP